MRRLIFLPLVLMAGVSVADVFVPVRVIRAKEIIGESDVMTKRSDLIGPALVIGQEARVTLYPNRPIRVGEVGPPAIVERNQTVTLVYRTGNLRIVTEGRVLDRGAVGEHVRVINLESRISVSGRIAENGWVEVN